jgi:hypothetical protein
MLSFATVAKILMTNAVVLEDLTVVGTVWGQNMPVKYEPNHQTKPEINFEAKRNDFLEISNAVYLSTGILQLVY